jgi:hypothetical protein
VAAHPDDKGMKAIADAIKKTETPQAKEAPSAIVLLFLRLSSGRSVLSSPNRCAVSVTRLGLPNTRDLISTADRCE